MPLQYCHKCNQKGSDGIELKKCSGCKCVYYCDENCQDKDWPSHKRHCKHLVFMKRSAAKALCDSRHAANPDSSEVYRRALQSAVDSGSSNVFALVTPRVAENFVRACHDDQLPSCETEERIWGLWGDPHSEGYQRLLWCYQKALKFGDLTAQKLMECLLAKPAASKALTKALKKVRFVMTEEDSVENVVYSLERYLAQVDGLEVVSEFDKWPVKDGQR